MHVESGNPQGKVGDELGIDTDRRRAGRLDGVSPELIPLLRGDFEGELPPEPEVDPAVEAEFEPLDKVESGPIVDRRLVLGVTVGAVLLLIGTVLRFAI